MGKQGKHAREPNNDNDNDNSSEHSSPSSLASTASAASARIIKAVNRASKTVKKTASKRARHSRASSGLSEPDGSAPIEVADSSDAEPDVEKDEDELERLQSRWSSPIYSFFHEKPDIRYKKNRKYHFFKCKKTTCKTGGVRRYLDGGDHSSTGNLKKHTVQCFGKDSVEAAVKGVSEAKTTQNSIFSMFAGLGDKVVSISHRMHTNPERRAAVVRWVTESCRPTNIVEDRKLCELMLAGRPQASFPRRKRVAEDVRIAFEYSSERIKSLLQEYPGQLSFATDAWTSPNHRAFVAWTVHLQHQGKPLVFLLDIFEVPESHTGIVLAHEFSKMVEWFGLQHKIMAFCGDNASSNDTQTTALSESPSNSFTLDSHVRCLNHTMNLAAKALLNGIAGFSDEDNATSLDADNLNGDIEENDEDLPALLEPDILSDDEDDDVDADVIDEGDEQVDEVAVLDAIAQATFKKESSEVRVALEKVRGLSFAIIYSTTIGLPQWCKACSKHKLSPRNLPRDIRPSLSQVQTHDFGMEHPQDLRYVLQIFKDATLHFSSEQHSSISAVIPAMDRIDDLLTTQTATTATSRPPLHASVKAALCLAKQLMNCYYSLTDDSSVYRIAMVLHPGLKLEYFRQRKWQDPWIREAERLTRQAYNAYVERARSRQAEEVPAPSTTSSSIPSTAGPSTITHSNDFANISVAPSTAVTTHDELADYLAMPLEKVSDPLLWWWEKRTVFPVLSQMALNYHSVPATSTSVERVFSFGRQLLVFTCNRLSGWSIRWFLCFGSWNYVSLLVYLCFAILLSGSLSSRPPQPIDQPYSIKNEDILGIVPLRYVPVFKHDGSDLRGKEIGLLDPLDMVAVVFEIQQQQEDDEYTPLIKVILTNLSTHPGWDLSGLSSSKLSLVPSKSSLSIWYKFAKSFNVKEEMVKSIAEEFESSVKWQCE
ncbi:hypothetical protein D9758_008967 [Tetrapyrgos nigripes]|uniref:HAT C-terminal dimerisation domain-containing protein n=1 Tax=Tetrapyrgos nigripes TaxID=182062 RepID=A0A8H5GK92_9AGAR|nr:hypothetical protein D9758_008967 [Tetrapyrgos nigripes]